MKTNNEFATARSRRYLVRLLEHLRQLHADNLNSSRCRQQLISLHQQVAQERQRLSQRDNSAFEHYNLVPALEAVGAALAQCEGLTNTRELRRELEKARDAILYHLEH